MENFFPFLAILMVFVTGSLCGIFMSYAWFRTVTRDGILVAWVLVWLAGWAVMAAGWALYAWVSPAHLEFTRSPVFWATRVGEAGGILMALSPGLWLTAFVLFLVRKTARR